MLLTRLSGDLPLSVCNINYVQRCIKLADNANLDIAQERFIKYLYENG